MAALLHFVKTIFIPLLTALVLYILLAYLVLPFVRRHRTRYSQYLPLTTEALSFTTLSWRTRLSDGLYNLFMPSSWAASRQVHHDGDATDDELFDDEEGEGMIGFDPVDERRREALRDRRNHFGDADRRLSRELEEGFKDDSDDDTADEAPRSLSGSRTTVESVH
ncbi:hypothetical protein M011DRAFT_470457 [Sporormia fimetaria CBS 119925]|uniref:Uncharacterized protein n=1 Tax=Sporormia fimetaria CBS 119925 TaxID=1340428 RepID=A0A6A6V3A9_9PLEO|nr:hypothetical protein M011DRAFT_470457 [Sporormia fimetaria CBS 119925]